MIRHNLYKVERFEFLVEGICTIMRDVDLCILVDGYGVWCIERSGAAPFSMS